MIELNLTNKSKPSTSKRRNDPCKLFRKALEEQIAGVIAEQNGQTATVKRRRFQDSQYVEVNVPLQKWWWRNDAKYFLTLRYSSQVIRLHNHQSIECGPSLSDIEKVLRQILSALDTHDEDVLKALETAYEKTRWKKRPSKRH